ncbi:MAG: hypothetical protein KDG55_13545 [Rhodocyclaceae bacterium]|nr:hypothetical protein [Rhodocyclaceae bacterium]
MAELRGCQFPESHLYHPASHLWFVPEGDDLFRVGVTEFGVAIAGEIILFTAKPPGVRLAAGRSFGLLEAGKTVFPVKTPFDAILVEAHEALERDGRPMNRDANGTWLVRLKATDGGIPGCLLGWPAAARAVEAEMHRYRFEHRDDFKPSLEDRPGGV